MMLGFTAITLALSGVWLGAVTAISFLEAPLKFRAPGVTTRIGLGIGRLVFRALNVVECLLLAGILAALLVVGAADFLFTDASLLALALLTAAGMLLVQLLLIRPLLNRRTAAALAGQSPGGSKTHIAYIVTELVKVIALLGCVLLCIALIGS